MENPQLAEPRLASAPDRPRLRGVHELRRLQPDGLGSHPTRRASLPTHDVVIEPLSTGTTPRSMPIGSMIGGGDMSDDTSARAAEPGRTETVVPAAEPRRERFARHAHRTRLYATAAVFVVVVIILIG